MEKPADKQGTQQRNSVEFESLIYWWLYNERSQHYIFFINALSNNLETVMSLVKAQSAIIENLNNQVSTAIKGIGNEKEFKNTFDKFANHTKQIQNVTKKMN